MPHPFRMAFSHADHDCSDHDCAGGFSLYKQVDSPRVRALNVLGGGEQAARLFRPWDQRADTSIVAESEDGDDPEVIIHVPLTSDIKLKSIALVGGSGGSAPSQMRVWINRDDIDFSNAGDVEPLQEWSLGDGGLEALEYPTRYTKFQGVNSVTFHFPNSLRGSGEINIHFIGLKGEVTGNRRDALCTFVYEALPSAKDHKTVAEDGAPSLLM